MCLEAPAPKLLLLICNPLRAGGKGIRGISGLTVTTTIISSGCWDKRCACSYGAVQHGRWTDRQNVHTHNTCTHRSYQNAAQPHRCRRTVAHPKHMQADMDARTAHNCRYPQLHSQPRSSAPLCTSLNSYVRPLHALGCSINTINLCQLQGTDCRGSDTLPATSSRSLTN